MRADLHREAMGENVPIGTPRTSGVATELWGEVGSIGGGLDEKDHLGCYNGYWWFNRRTTDGKTLLPDVPKGAFFGSGWGGRALMLGIPEEDLVVAWLYVRPHERKTWTPFCKRGRYRVNEMLGYLLEARTGKAR